MENLNIITVPTKRNKSLKELNYKLIDGENFCSIRFETEKKVKLCEMLININDLSGEITFDIVDVHTDLKKYINRFSAKYFSEMIYVQSYADDTFKLWQKRIKGFTANYMTSEEIEVEIEVPTTPETKVESPKKDSTKVVTKLEPKKEPKKEIKKVIIERPKAVGLEAQLQDMVFNALESDFTTQTIQNKMIELGIEPNRTEIVVKAPSKAPKNLGIQHKEFKTILMMVSAGVNIALVGPAGSGKTTTVSHVAKALGFEFYSQSVSAQTGSHEFFGYKNANGEYVRTLFREAYEFGGVFLLDEFDAGNPNVLAALNQATANGHCSFADKMVTKHKDFLVVMAGNTFGHGATSEYVGRNKIDAATLDRFAFLKFDYDEKMEHDLATNKSWCKIVQGLRAKAKDKKIRTIISPRATFDGAKLLDAGMSIEKVKEVIIYKGLSKDEINLLK